MVKLMAAITWKISRGKNVIRRKEKKLGNRFIWNSLSTSLQLLCIVSYNITRGSDLSKFKGIIDFYRNVWSFRPIF